MWSITERFPTWGENGEFPVDGFFYEGGDQVNEKHLDALWNGLKEFENETRAALEDIDSDGDGVVDKADDADTVGGEPPSNFADTNHGNGEHTLDFTTLTEVNNNADVPNADFADNAGDADTVDGEDANSFAKLNAGVQAPVYASTSDVPSGIGKGEFVYIDGDGLYVEDGN